MTEGNPASGKADNAVVALQAKHRRLARYLYASPLSRQKRILDIGGEVEGAALLSQQGAKTVLLLEVSAGEAPSERGQSPLRPGDGVTVRRTMLAELKRPGVLRSTLGSAEFDLVFLRATAELLTPAFLGELRAVLVRGGLIVATALSKEARGTSSSESLGYFDLLDGLNGAGFGPVSMLGQSAFLGSAVMPYGQSDPPLVFDDTLAIPDAAEEYIAIGGLPAGHSLPYQLIKLPPQALAPSVKVLTERVEVKVPDVEGAREREKLQAQLLEQKQQKERDQQELTTARLGLRAVEDRLQTAISDAKAKEAQVAAVKAKLDEVAAALHAEQAQRKEINERLKTRDQGEAEASHAALLHERQMRELRLALEERDAFVSELEQQSRDVPKILERAAKMERALDESQRAERQTRQRLAEVEGLLLRAKAERLAHEATGKLALALEDRAREIESTRRELLGQRDGLEQASESLARDKQALDQAKAQLEKDRHELAQRLMASQASDQARSEEVVLRQEAQREATGLRALTHELKETLSQRDRELASVRSELVLRMQERVPRSRESGDGIPLPVGDLPTAPLQVQGSAEESAAVAGEVARLRQKLAEVLAEGERLKDKLSEAERETWKHMKARSEAEAAAAEVREDTVRKLRDARKLASVELTRAMEDATKKAVQLREDLARTDAERKELLAQLKEVRVSRDGALDQVARLQRELGGAAELGAGGFVGIAIDGGGGLSLEQVLLEERAAREAAQQSADEAQSDVIELRQVIGELEQAVLVARAQAAQEQERSDALEQSLRSGGENSDGHLRGESMRLKEDLLLRDRMVVERTAERDALARLLAEVEREAAARGERARTLRIQLAEREREVEVLRIEIMDRDRRLAALEQVLPPGAEQQRLQDELRVARKRMDELLEETARRDQLGDDAVSTALRERARAVRLNEALEQAVRERDELRGQLADLDQRMSELLSETEHLRGELFRRQGQALDE